VIEVEENSTEKNEDWWQGKLRGQTGLFPSSYVERITHSLPPAPPAPTIVKSSRPGSEVAAPTYTPYRSTHVAMNQYQSEGGPNALGLQPSQPEEAKRAKYDHLRSTVRTFLSYPPRSLSPDEFSVLLLERTLDPQVG
jgi:LAS seventeen-binding protein 1/2